MHGGAIGQWVDIVTSAVILSFLRGKTHVSVDLSVDYLDAIDIGSNLILKAILIKATKKYAFTECHLMNERGKLLATGYHKKIFIT